MMMYYEKTIRKSKLYNNNRKFGDNGKSQLNIVVVQIVRNTRYRIWYTEGFSKSGQ